MRYYALCLAILLSLSASSALAADVSKLVLPGDITLEQAMVAIKAAEAKAKETNTLMDIAIVDAGANLKAFVRMDGAYLGSIDIAMKKARSARMLNMSTKTLGEASQVGKSLYGIEVTNGGMAIFGGGELLTTPEGLIIGAIGVSGGSVEEDIAVAKAGVEALLATQKVK